MEPRVQSQPWTHRCPSAHQQSPHSECRRSRECERLSMNLVFFFFLVSNIIVPRDTLWIPKLIMLSPGQIGVNLHRTYTYYTFSCRLSTNLGNYLYSLMSYKRCFAVLLRKCYTCPYRHTSLRPTYVLFIFPFLHRLPLLLAWPGTAM